MPNWGSNLEGIDFDNIKYFVRSTEKQATSWEELPGGHQKTPMTAWASRRPRSSVWWPASPRSTSPGGLPPDPGGPRGAGRHLPRHRHRPEGTPGDLQENFGTVIPAGGQQVLRLNTAVWSGGSFIYVPPGVHVDIPLQAYFRINTENMGQFERTLIIADEGSYVTTSKGCTRPSTRATRCTPRVVEIIVKPGARVRYTTIQNWSNNVYNLVTKRARAEAGATMEWIDGNIGSKVTMKYPAVG